GGAEHESQGAGQVHDPCVLLEHVPSPQVDDGFLRSFRSGLRRGWSAFLAWSGAAPVSRGLEPPALAEGPAAHGWAVCRGTTDGPIGGRRVFESGEPLYRAQN